MSKSQSSTYVKSTDAFTLHVGGIEPAFEAQTDYITPNEQFFVCSESATPRISAQDYCLEVDGDGINSPLTLSYDDLRAMPQRTVPALLECAGNHRRLFETVLGEPLDKRPEMVELLWNLGAVGMAEWEGVPLSNLLSLAGVTPQAYHVCPIGIDRHHDGAQVSCPLPISKALDDDTLIALRMNGQPLPPDHGFPARLVVPGWVGTYSIKWLSRITVSTTHIWVQRNTTRYILRGEHWDASKYAPADGPSVTESCIRSSLALSWPAQLHAGTQTLHGFARSSNSPIASVQWSADGGASWQGARLVGPNQKYAWAKFEFDWQATPGQHALMTRATDALGRTQPDTVPFNDCGYLFNMVHPHPVEVI